MLSRELGVPIGLIQSAWGGTEIEPWVPLGGFEAEPALAEYVPGVRAMAALSDPADPDDGVTVALDAKVI